MWWWIFCRFYFPGDKTSKDDLVMAIEGGNAAMAIAWPGWYTPTGGGSADYVALPGKQDASAVAYNANVYGVWTLGISAKSENQKMTEKLLEYLMDPEVQKETIDSGGVPCRYSCLQDPDILEKYPYFDQIGVALESGTYRPVMAEWNDFVTILGRHMNLMLEDEEDIDSGLSAAQTELEELLK